MSQRRGHSGGAAVAEAGFDTPSTGLPLSAVADAWNGDPKVRHILAPGW